MGIEQLKAWKNDARSGVIHEADRLEEKGRQISGLLQVLDATDELFSEIDNLKKELNRRQDEIDDLSNQLEQKDREVGDLQRQLLEAKNKHLEAEIHAKPMEIHNHFEPGSNSQVFNDKVTGKFSLQPPTDSMPLNDEQPEVTALVACVDGVREYFWSDSSLAVIFCVCRDCYGYTNNMSQFERDFHCQEGLISNTFRNNSYMRLPVSKWAQNGAKERVLRLVEAYRNAVEERLKS